MAVHDYFGHFLTVKGKKWGKMGQNMCARSDYNHVWLILMKSVLNEKGVFPQMIKVCKKKFYLSKEKLDFLPFL